MQHGMPYMGSKSGIIPSLAMCFPKAENFYDLFGGGGSVTHYMMTHMQNNYKSFHYNEIQIGVASLFERVVKGEFSCERFKPAWISKKEFLENKEKDFYLKVIWSFGNAGVTYLYSEDIEPYKKSMHMAVVFDEFDALAQEVFGFNKWPEIANTITKRRLYLRQKIEWFNKNKNLPKCLYQFLKEEQLKQLGKIGVIKQLKQLEQLERLQQLQQLQQLERLQQLQQLQQLERLSITSLDYRQVDIKSNSVVYCDIPYAGTAGYGAKDRSKNEKNKSQFNHKEFFDWAMSRDFPVFISEYNIPDKRFKLVYSIKKRSMLADESLIKDREGCGYEEGSGKLMEEKLYWNGKSL